MLTLVWSSFLLSRARQERREAAAAADAATASSDGLSSGTGSPPLSPPSPLLPSGPWLGAGAVAVGVGGGIVDEEQGTRMPPAPVVAGRPDIAGILGEVCALAGAGAEVGILAAGASTCSQTC